MCACLIWKIAYTWSQAFLPLCGPPAHEWGVPHELERVSEQARGRGEDNQEEQVHLALRGGRHVQQPRVQGVRQGESLPASGPGSRRLRRSSLQVTSPEYTLRTHNHLLSLQRCLQKNVLRLPQLGSQLGERRVSAEISRRRRSQGDQGVGRSRPTTIAAGFVVQPNCSILHCFYFYFKKCMHTLETRSKKYQNKRVRRW